MLDSTTGTSFRAADCRTPGASTAEFDAGLRSKFRLVDLRKEHDALGGYGLLQPRNRFRLRIGAFDAHDAVAIIRPAPASEFMNRQKTITMLENDDAGTEPTEDLRIGGPRHRAFGHDLGRDEVQLNAGLLPTL